LGSGEVLMFSPPAEGDGAPVLAGATTELMGGGILDKGAKQKKAVEVARD